MVQIIKSKILCPSCGELEVDERGMIIHPAMDCIMAQILQSGFKTEDVGGSNHSVDANGYCNMGCC